MKWGNASSSWRSNNPRRALHAQRALHGRISHFTQPSPQNYPLRVVSNWLCAVVGLSRATHPSGAMHEYRSVRCTAVSPNLTQHPPRNYPLWAAYNWLCVVVGLSRATHPSGAMHEYRSVRCTAVSPTSHNTPRVIIRYGQPITGCV
jgi:hypothetical protein